MTSAGAIAAAAKSTSVPLNVVRVEDDTLRAFYDRDYVLIRPDQHVAWRGNAIPEHPGCLLKSGYLLKSAGRETRIDA